MNPSIRQVRQFLFLLVAALVPLLAKAQVSASYEEELLKSHEMRVYDRLLKGGSSLAAPGYEYDVHYYRLDLAVDTGAVMFSGSVRMLASSQTAALTSILLDFTNNAAIDSVHVDGVSQSYSQTSLTLQISLGRSYGSGELFTTEVYYSVLPVGTGFGSVGTARHGNGTRWIWTLSEPYGARDWWPSKDHPTDKADSVDIIIRCPSNFLVGSQGVLISTVDNGDGTKTYSWKHRYPIATYLVSLAMTNYVSFSDWWQYSPTDSMEILNYVLPESYGSALIDLSSTKAMLQIFSDRFGLYPFVTEKYGHSQFGWGGAMEHQTMTSTGTFNEITIAHEAAHQWFGDLITLSSWSDIWLNEGFASFCESVYLEGLYGIDGYRSRMSVRMAQAKFAVGPIHVTDTLNVGSLFNGSRSYSKGATVLHMLRKVLGDSAFFAGMKNYATDSRFVYGTASTAQFQGVMETVSGKDLSYFFDEWIYGEGYPTYYYQWGYEESGGSFQTRVFLSQTTPTSNPSVFTMPIDLRFVGVGGDTTVTVLNDSSYQLYTVTLPFMPDSVLLDPDDWILKDAQGVQVSIKDGQPTVVRYELDPNFPNPFNASTTIRYGLERRSRVRIDIFDLLGRRITTLLEEERPAGFHSVVWTTNVTSGVYFYRITATSVGTSPQTYTETRRMLLMR